MKDNERKGSRDLDFCISKIGLSERSNTTSNNIITLNEQSAYHGTNKEFDSFDLDKFQRGDYGYGVYFTRTKSHASNYGNVKQYEIPESEDLLDWEESYNYQSEKVQDALYNIWQDTKEQDKEKLIDKAMFSSYGNSGESIYYAISQALGYTAKQMNEFLQKYGIKGIETFRGDCIVIFNPKDIKQNTFAELNEHLKRFL